MHRDSLNADIKSGALLRKQLFTKEDCVQAINDLKQEASIILQWNEEVKGVQIA
jgi:hypothetical protein